MDKPEMAFTLSRLPFPLNTQNNTRPGFSLHLRCCAAISGMKNQKATGLSLGTRSLRRDGQVPKHLPHGRVDAQAGAWV